MLVRVHISVIVEVFTGGCHRFCPVRVYTNTHAHTQAPAHIHTQREVTERPIS